MYIVFILSKALVKKKLISEKQPVFNFNKNASNSDRRERASFTSHSPPHAANVILQITAIHLYIYPDLTVA